MPADVLYYSATPAQALEVPYTETIEEKIDRYALKYEVSAKIMYSLAKCESGLNPTIQSGHKYTYSRPEQGIYEGERELSFGISQIHLPAHPSITKQMATDPDFSLDFMAKHIKAGNAPRMWVQCWKVATQGG
jgi:hypothetical protein